MSLIQSLLRSIALLCVTGPMALNYATAQSAAEYEPKVGQQGKDVIWVPTEQALVHKMLDVAQVTSNDYLVDLGSGDGRTVITAAKRGTRALGIEYNPAMVDLSRRNAAAEGVEDRASFVQADLFESDFSEATVLTMFLLPDINIRLRPKILAMRPGTRVVSNSFTMDDWSPDKTVQIGGNCRSYCRAYLWVVPAKVAGTWQLPQGELVLEQKYQMISGTLRSGNVITPVKGRVSGDQITFTVRGTKQKGQVNGNVMEGTSGLGHSKASWRAQRV